MSGLIQIDSLIYTARAKAMSADTKRNEIMARAQREYVMKKLMDSNVECIQKTTKYHYLIIKKYYESIIRHIII